jgi:hypothetical protein
VNDDCRSSNERRSNEITTRATAPASRAHKAYRDDYWYEVCAGLSEDGMIVVAIERKSSKKPCEAPQRNRASYPVLLL